MYMYFSETGSLVHVQCTRTCICINVHVHVHASIHLGKPAMVSDLEWNAVSGLKPAV